MNNRDIVQKLWGLCNVLRDDGITYHQYVNELTYLLFLKMAQEIGSEGDIPEGYRWKDLVGQAAEAQFDFYRRQLVVLGTTVDATIRAIFANPTSLLRHRESLSTLVTKIDEIDWYNVRREGLGDIYEGLLERNASEKKSGAGQYFTPRPLIETIVNLVKPGAGDVIHDPAASTGGFLVVANDYIAKGKGCYFPLVDETTRVPDTVPAPNGKGEAQAHRSLYRVRCSVARLCVEDGKVVERYKAEEDATRAERAKVSIELFHLNEGTLIRDRHDLYVALDHSVKRIEELETVRGASGVLTDKQILEFDALIDQIADRINASAPFSAFARACLRQNGDLGWNTELLATA